MCVFLFSFLENSRQHQEGDNSENYSGTWFKCYRRRRIGVNPCGRSTSFWLLVAVVYWRRLGFGGLLLARSNSNQKDFPSWSGLADGPTGDWRRSPGCQWATTHRMYQLRKLQTSKQTHFLAPNINSDC